LFTTKFLGIQAIPDKTQQLIHKFLLLSLSGTFLGFLSSTFFILFVIDSIGFAQASIILSFTLLVQLLIDYPSGSLGDWIGQRWVLTIANACFAIAFYLLSTADTFESFLLIAFFNGLGNAQASGALGTWLDSNYQNTVKNADPERKIYGFCMARVGSLNRLVMALAFTIGGAIATLTSRQFVFFIQSGLLVIIIFLVISIVKDIEMDTSSMITKKRTSLRDALKFLKGGIVFFASSKIAFFFIVGTAAIFASFNIWGTLILFPIYFGYTGSDALASMYRTIIFLIGLPIGIYVANVSKRFSNDKLPFLYYLFFLLFYPCFMILLIIIPTTDEFNLIGLIITAILLTTNISLVFDVAETLRRRTMVDLVPSENRNAVYSLIPTIISVIGIPLLPIAGQLIETYNLSMGIAVALVISLVGSTFVFLSLHFKKKSAEEFDKQLIAIEEGIPA
jgi:AAHS family cis,cis-muconate transporter-like MFS transporter